jgi:malonyl-CoA/methylmalonyl-CoA synthetase
VSRLLPLEPSDKVALRFGPPGDTVELTYRELAGAASALVPQIRGCTRVAVHATPSIHTAVGVVAALLAGVPVVPLNPKLGERERAQELTDAAPERVLAAPDTDVPYDIPRIDVDIDGDGPVPPEPEATDPALVIYTSGTTGLPKGAVHSRRALAANLDALAAAWEWTGDDLLAHALPLFHIHGLVLGVLGPLRRGGTLHHLGTLAAQALAASGATLVFGVPTQYHRLADQLEGDPEAAALTTVDHQRLRKLTGLAVRERYGMTETLILTAARASDEPEPGTVGPPVEGTDVRITGDGEMGPVEVRGPSLFDGYLNRPDATAEAETPDGWFATGDIGRWTASGALAIVGRSGTDLIKSGGYKIGAGEIENALLEHAGVAEAAVIGVPDDDLGERIVAHVVPEGEAPTERELIDHVATLLAPHKRPRQIRFTDALPRNDMGKVMKGRLPKE